MASWARLRWASALAVAATLAASPAAGTLPQVQKVIAPEVALTGFEFPVSVELAWAPGAEDTLTNAEGVIYCRVTGEGVDEVNSFPASADGLLAAEGSCGDVRLGDNGNTELLVEVAFTYSFSSPSSGTASVRTVPGVVTLLPPVVAIVLAVLTRDVLVSLFCGVWVGAFLVHGYNPLAGFLRTLDTYIVEAFADEGHIKVILFSWALSGIMALVQRSGGAQGLAAGIKRIATSRRRTMLACFVAGILIFFDDYSNALIVGGTFRALTDAMLISREKLAFLVDATSAPVASIAPISSWIGFELSLIEDSLKAIKAAGADLSGWQTSPFLVFVNTIPGRFYPIAMLCLQLLLILTQRDFGPMFHAERRAVRDCKLYADDANKEQTRDDDAMKSSANVPQRWWNGAVPILLIVFIVLLSIILTGLGALREAGDVPGFPAVIPEVFGQSDPFNALLWTTFFVTFVTWLLYRVQYHKGGEVMSVFVGVKETGAAPLMTFKDSMDTWIDGVKQLVSTTLVLLLAWAISNVLDALGTNTFIASAVSGSVDPRGLPALVFLLSALISTATGTSWGTMAIMFPVATRTVFQAAPGNEALMSSTIGSILSGSVFGDHITPISDTTILSSLATRCDLMHHVRTQAPYAIVVATVSIIAGDLLSSYLYPTPAGLCITVAIVLLLGWGLSARPDAADVALDPLSRIFRVAPPAAPEPFLEVVQTGGDTGQSEVKLAHDRTRSSTAPGDGSGRHHRLGSRLSSIFSKSTASASDRSRRRPANSMQVDGGGSDGPVDPAWPMPETLLDPPEEGVPLAVESLTRGTNPDAYSSVRVPDNEDKHLLPVPMPTFGKDGPQAMSPASERDLEDASAALGIDDRLPLTEADAPCPSPAAGSVAAQARVSDNSAA